MKEREREREKEKERKGKRGRKEEKEKEKNLEWKSEHCHQLSVCYSLQLCTIAVFFAFCMVQFTSGSKKILGPCLMSESIQIIPLGICPFFHFWPILPFHQLLPGFKNDGMHSFFAVILASHLEKLFACIFLPNCPRMFWLLVVHDCKIATDPLELAAGTSGSAAGLFKPGLRILIAAGLFFTGSDFWKTFSKELGTSVLILSSETGKVATAKPLSPGSMLLFWMFPEGKSLTMQRLALSKYCLYSGSGWLSGWLLPIVSADSATD